MEKGETGKQARQIWVLGNMTLQVNNQLGVTYAYDLLQPLETRSEERYLSCK